MHIKHLLKILLLTLLFTPALGWSYGFYTPQGYREALMANTGIALNASEGAAIYNPAGAAGLESSRISAGGSLLNASIFKIDNNSTVGSISDKNTSPSYSQIPGLITGYQKTTWGRTGFFINSDFNLIFDKLIAFSSNYGNSYSQMVNNINSLNLGVIYANSSEISAGLKLQYGITISLNMIENQSSLFNKSYITSTNSYSSAFSNTNIKTTNLSTRLGTLLASDDYSFGAYFQPKGSPLSSSYSKFAYSVTSTGDVVDDSKNDGPSLSLSQTYGIGAGFVAAKSLRLYIDINVVAPDKSISEDIQGDRVESLGIGADYTMNNGNHIYAGVSHSESKDANNSYGWSVSSGFDYKISFIKNYFGAYYTSLITPPGNEPGASAGSALSWFGVLIASQYSF